MLKQLHARHEVVFAGLVSGEEQQKGTEQAGEYCSKAYWVDHSTPSHQSLAFAAGALANLLPGSKPYAVARFASHKLHDLIASVLEAEAFDLVVCDFLFPAASLPWHLHKPGQSPHWVLFQHNVESLIWERRAASKRGLASLYLKAQASRMRSFEGTQCRKFDGILTVSADDSATLTAKFDLPQVLGVVPTGVDAAYFQALPREIPLRPTIVFVGSMDWYANVDAVTFFANEVWPRVRQELPNAVFQIVGRTPPPDVIALQSEAMGIEVSGTVPDVRPFMRRSHAMVVPLRIGGGTRLKIYEAMAAELPVVSTRIGAEGLPVADGEHLLLADDAEQMATAVLRLCRDVTYGQHLAQQAYSEVIAKHTWEAAAAEFERLCRQAMEGTAPK
ncbi:MAG: glycosyltransferase [Roseimicrobium sp.]